MKNIERLRALFCWSSPLWEERWWGKWLRAARSRFRISFSSAPPHQQFQQPSRSIFSIRGGLPMWAVFFSYKVIMNLACSVNSSEFLFAWVTFSSRWLLAIPMAKTSKIQPRFQSVFSWVKLPCLNCQRCSKRSFSQSLNTPLCKSVLHHLKVSDQDPSYTMRIGGGTPPQLWLMPYNLVEWGEDWEVGQVEMPHSHKLETVWKLFHWSHLFCLFTKMVSMQLSLLLNNCQLQAIQLGIFCSLKDPQKRYFS